MKFNKFTPATLRFAIEKELQAMEMPNVKMAAVIALNRLKEDPEHYLNKYGFADPLEKARPTKYIKRYRKPDGSWGYVYKEEIKDNSKNKTEKIKLQMRFDSHGLISSYETIGYSARVGVEKTNAESLKKAEEFENSISTEGKEKTRVIDNKGNVILDETGDHEVINLDKHYDIIRESEVLTHTHPEDKSFSVEDVFLALSLGIKELRVKTPNNTYFFKISHKEELEGRELRNKNRKFINTIDNINDEITDFYRKIVPQGIISQKEAEKEHREVLWVSVTSSPVLKEDFNMEYGKVKK